MTANWYRNPAPMVRRMRAYFAPVDRRSQSPAGFEAAEQGSFDLDNPPSPWVSLGWIKGFTRTPSSKSSVIMTGVPAAALEQTRESVEARVSFEFLSWSKLTMALATGSQHMNLLAVGTDGKAVGAVAVESGSTASFLAMSAQEAAGFAAGSLVVVDEDYAAQTGYVGSPVAGAYLRQAAGDVDYVRRVSFNLALIEKTSKAGLTLAQPLPGGAPGAGAKAQCVAGFMDREGGSFYQEWSALFVVEGSQGERIFFYYPRLQSSCGAGEELLEIDGEQSSLRRMALKGRYLALPVTDALDGERVVCYRSYLPAAQTLA